MKIPKLELVGHIGVDAGLIYIGDPGYEIGSDTDGKFQGTWADFCDLLYGGKKGMENGVLKMLFPLGREGQAVVVSSGYGDGTYPVYVDRKDGRIARVIVDFMSEDDEDEAA